MPSRTAVVYSNEYILPHILNHMIRGYRCSHGARTCPRIYAILVYQVPDNLTPQPLLSLVYDCLGPLNLDPCSNSHLHPQVLADKYYTVLEDGLQHPWYGTAFVNPPYTYVSAWAHKFLDEYTAGHMTAGILLVAASVETRWYQTLGRSPALICHLNQRQWFDQSPGVPCKERARFPSVLFYLGDQPARFRKVFDAVGFIR